MQVAIFTIAGGDHQALDELNRFLRGHRVLTLDREYDAGGWSFCVTYLPPAGVDGGGGPGMGKVDYRAVLDEKTFALFSTLRALRKQLAEQETLPPYAVFTNEQLAEIARQRCSTPAALEKITGVGAARVEKYGAAVCAAVEAYEKQSSASRTSGGPTQPS